MEQVFFRVHVRTVSAWCGLINPTARNNVEKFTVASAIIVLGLLTHLHVNYVGSNIDHACFLDAMNTTYANFHRHDIIAIRASHNVHPAVLGERDSTILHTRGDNYDCCGSAHVSDNCSPLVAYCQDSVTNDKMTYIYSRERGFLMLSPSQKLSHNITTLSVNLPLSCRCFGYPPLSWLIHGAIGYDTILINLLARVFDETGFLYKKQSGQIFSLQWYTSLKHTPSVRSRHDGTEALSVEVDSTVESQPISTSVQHKVAMKLGLLLTIVFLFFTATTMVSFILKQTQSKMLKFTFLLQYHVQRNIPVTSLVFTHVLESLIFVPIMIGILFFMFEFFGDQLLAFLILTLVWVCEVYSVMSVRTYLSLKYYPKLVFVYFFAFHLYLFTNPRGFSYVALYATYCFVFHLMLYFFNHSEIPAYESGLITALSPRYPFTAATSTSGLAVEGAATSALSDITRLSSLSNISSLGHDSTSTITNVTDSTPAAISTTSVVGVMGDDGSNVSSSMSRVASVASQTERRVQNISTENIELEERNMTLGRVEYFSTDAATTTDEVFRGTANGSDNDSRGRVTRSFTTPLDEIIAFEQAVYFRRQCGSRGVATGTGGVMTSTNSSNASLAALDSSGKDDLRSDRLISDDKLSDAGLSDYGNFAYGGGGEDTEDADVMRQAELELSRQIQRQQMVAEMGFNLPRVTSRQLLTPVSTTLSASSEEVTREGFCKDTAERAHTDDAVKSSSRSATKRGPLSSFFINLFASNKRAVAAPSVAGPPSRDSIAMLTQGSNSGTLVASEDTVDCDKQTDTIVNKTDANRVQSCVSLEASTHKEAGASEEGGDRQLPERGVGLGFFRREASPSGLKKMASRSTPPRTSPESLLSLCHLSASANPDTVSDKKHHESNSGPTGRDDSELITHVVPTVTEVQAAVTSAENGNCVESAVDAGCAGDKDNSSSAGLIECGCACDSLIVNSSADACTASDIGADRALSGSLESIPPLDHRQLRLNIDLNTLQQGPAQRCVSGGALYDQDHWTRRSSGNTLAFNVRQRAMSDTVAMLGAVSPAGSRSGSVDSSLRSRTVSEVDYLDEERNVSFSIFGMDLDEEDEQDDC